VTPIVGANPGLFGEGMQVLTTTSPKRVGAGSSYAECGNSGLGGCVSITTTVRSNLADWES
jgi:hypothetical protein